jgi:hypothetical protein
LTGCAASEALGPPGAERSWGSEASCQKQEGQDVLGEADSVKGRTEDDMALNCTSRCSSSSSISSLDNCDPRDAGRESTIRERGIAASPVPGGRCAAVPALTIPPDGQGQVQEAIVCMRAVADSQEGEVNGSVEASCVVSCVNGSQVNGASEQSTLLLQETQQPLESPGTHSAGRSSQQGSPAGSPAGLRRVPRSPARRSPAGSRGSTRGSPLSTPGSSSRLTVPAGEGGLQWEVPSAKCRIWPGGSLPQPDFVAEGDGNHS